MIDLQLQRHAFTALSAAALFGASAPLSKLLLGGAGPFSLAALLYMGSGAGLLLAWIMRRRTGSLRIDESPLQGRDFLWLAGAILSGGVVAPVLLLWGLSGLGASTASLLLSTEGVLTLLISAVAFREQVGKRIWIAAGLMLAAGMLLMYTPGMDMVISVRAVAVIAACALWGLDNNLTRPISGADPLVIAMAKGLAAGTTNLILSRLAGEDLPGLSYLVGGLLVGSVSYGTSLLLYIVALRHLGSARAAAHFGTAPFFGAILSIVVLGDAVTPVLAGASVLMLLATWIALAERHEHAHCHEAMEHAHRHVHDARHQHVHDGGEGPEPHAHTHRHDATRHSHAHLPDLHHRHKH